MKTSICNLLFAGIICSGLVLTGCSKSTEVSDLNNNPQQLKISSDASGAGVKDDGTSDDGTKNAETGMLNRDLGIAYASDGKTDMSGQFSGYTFRFKGAYPTGDALVNDGQTDQLGNWSSKEGSNVVIMDFHSSSSKELGYLSRQWTMQPSTSAGTMKLVAADGDQIMMSAK